VIKKGKVFIALALALTMLVSICSAASYTVKKGDNLWKIAQKNDVTVQDIVDANPAIKDPSLIYVDQVLEIPSEESSAPAVGGASVSGSVNYGSTTVPSDVIVDDGAVYLPIDVLSKVLGYDIVWDAETKTVKISSGVAAVGDSISITNDNVKITDASFDPYFPGTTAAEAVAKLLAEGKCYVNGIQVPASPEGLVEYQVNKVPSLYKTDIGWGYNVHKTTSANNLTYDQARLGFFETITTVRGHVTELTLDPETKAVTKINVNSLDVVRVTDIIVYNESTTIVRGDFALETQRVRPDVNKEIFNTAYFDQSIEIGDIAMYWFGPNGWEIKKAVPMVGTLAKDPNNNKVFVVNGGKADEYSKVESNVSRYNLIDSSRPSQFYTAYTRMGLTDMEVTTWCTDTGHPIGFTTGANSKAVLTRAIATAKAAKEGVTISATGEGITGVWTTQEAMDAFDAAIAKAEAVLRNNLSSDTDRDMAMYQLSLAYGEAGNKPSGFIGSLGNYEAEKPEEPKPADPQPGDKPVADNVKSWDNDNVKITDASFDSYFPGTTAADAVAKLLAEGKCYVNGIKVPATAAETEDYQVNFVSSLYKTETGWGYNVHKTTSANNLTFEAARLGFFETITTVRGHETTLTYDANGNVERIDTESFDVFRIAYFENHGGQVDKIMRGDFELETNRVRFDVEKITAVNSENFDESIDVGDVVVYYYGPNGWVMEKAMAKPGTVAKDPDNNKVFVVNGGKADEYIKVESNVSRYNLINSSRPTQFYDSYVRLGLTELDVITWCTPNGFPIGFTLGSRADSKATLLQAVKNAEAAKTGVVVSENYGEDVPVGTKWVTQEAMDTFDAAIKAAKATAYNNTAELYEYDMAMYELANALGQGGNKPSGFIGSQGDGTM